MMSRRILEVNNRAQASTEYMVVVAVVVVIAIVVVAVFGGFVDVGRGASDKTSKAYWRGAEIGLMDWSIKENGEVTLSVRNNMGESIRLAKVEFDSQDINILPTNLMVGEKKTLTGTTSAGVGQYSKKVKITYESGKYSLLRTFEGEEPIVGAYFSSSGSGSSTTTVGGNGTTTTVPAGSLSCSVKSSCGGSETDVLHMSAATNAHAELSTQSNYANKVCCGAEGKTLTVGSSGGQAIVLKLSTTTNAHVGTPAGSSYSNEIHISASSGTISCTYVASCTLTQTCVASISGADNAHTADCYTNPYSTRVCCEIT